MFFDNIDKEVEEEVGSIDKEEFFDNEEEEVEDIFTEVDNIDLEVINILFVFFQVSVW